MGRAGPLTPRIQVHPSLILWLSILWYLDSAVVLPFLAAAGFHELGHALALYSLDKPPSTIRLSFAGAVMEVPGLSYREELFAAAAGPAASLLLGLLTPLWPGLGLYSLALGLFNLLPLYGLDGSRMLRAFLLPRCSLDAAETRCRAAAVTTALILLWGALRLWRQGSWGLWPVVLAGYLLLKALLTRPL